MKKLISSLFILSIILTSCGPSAIKFNDAVVDIQELANKDYENATGMILENIENEDYSALPTSVKNGVDSLSFRIETVKKLEIPSGGEEFHSKAVKYFETLIDAVKAYEKYTILSNEEVTEEAIEAVHEDVTAKEDAFDTAFNEFATAQKAFAAEKNFKLEYK